MIKIKSVDSLKEGEYGLTKCCGKPECIFIVTEIRDSTMYFKVVKSFDGRGIQFSDLYKLNKEESLAYIL